MTKIIDITGHIDEGMWSYPAPYPEISIDPMPPVPWAGGKVYVEIFTGMNSQTGTYLETPAHYYGNDNSYLLTDVPVENLYRIPCAVFDLGQLEVPTAGGRTPVTLEMIQSCPAASLLEPGDAILFSTGWGQNWFNDNFLDGPYLTKEAMDWFISKKPFLLGSDLARWENIEHPEGIFDDFYAADILLAGPFINLDLIKQARCLLTILPINVAKTSCAPCRALVELI
ncbi:MAG: cyclase family protein [Clostridiaceae bacterium]|nr:cyclase family protein [Clostridiaceae bacterium]